MEERFGLEVERALVVGSGSASGRLTAILTTQAS